MTFLCEASFRRTGSGGWSPWIASSSEGACGASLGSGQGRAAQPVTAAQLSPHRLSPLPLPDSLTTWEIHGVSLSKTTGEAAHRLHPPCCHPSTQLPLPFLQGRGCRQRGRDGHHAPPPLQWLRCLQVSDVSSFPTHCSPGLCVATPVQLRVFREFHLHLPLPISVHRFEQLELRPVLYNYLDTDLTVRPVGAWVHSGVGAGVGVGDEESNELTGLLLFLPR